MAYNLRKLNVWRLPPICVDDDSDHEYGTDERERDDYISLCEMIIPNINKLVQLTELDLSGKIYDDDISTLTNLKTLNIDAPTTTITEKGFSHLISLTSFSIQRREITDNSLSRLVNLKSLGLSYTSITKNSLIRLTNLTTLKFWWVRCFSEEDLSNLTNLETLFIGETTGFTNRSLVNLTNLRCLDIYIDNSITDKGITHLTNLTELKLWETSITEEGILPLVNLVNREEVLESINRF